MIDNIYFDDLDLSTKNVFVLDRLSRNLIDKNSALVEFSSGDILEVVFSKATIIYTFEGICMGIRRRRFMSDKTSLILRNVLIRTGVELICAFFSTRICLKLAILDYKRKAFFYVKSKLYYLRRRVNRASRVKS